MKEYKKPVSLANATRKVQRGFFSAVAESVSAFAGGVSQGVQSVAKGSDNYERISDSAFLSVKKAAMS